MVDLNKKKERKAKVFFFLNFDMPTKKGNSKPAKTAKKPKQTNGKKKSKVANKDNKCNNNTEFILLG